jgi:Domain of unknown function (DUF4359)
MISDLNQKQQKIMKTSKLGFIGVGLILTVGAIAAGITNPDQETYQNFATTKVDLYIQEQGCAKIPASLGDFLQNQCKLLVKKMNPELANLVIKNTQRKNFLLFSVYVTELTLPSPLPSYHFETLGGLNNFWILKAEEQNSNN